MRFFVGIMGKQYETEAEDHLGAFRACVQNPSNEINEIGAVFRVRREDETSGEERFFASDVVMRELGLLKEDQ